MLLRLFDQVVEQYLTDNTVTSANIAPTGAQGTGEFTTADTYAPGDARLPKVLGATIKRGGKIKKKKGKKKRSTIKEYRNIEPNSITGHQGNPDRRGQLHAMILLKIIRDNEKNMEVAIDEIQEYWGDLGQEYGGPIYGAAIQDSVKKQLENIITLPQPPGSGTGIDPKTIHIYAKLALHVINSTL